LQVVVDVRLAACGYSRKGVTLMLDRVWVGLKRLDLRLQRLYVGLASVAFLMPWLTVGVVATRHWHAMSTESHVWVVLLLWMSLVLWIALLRGKARPSGTIGCLAIMLWAAGMLWFQHLR
jgi:uncharacterized membrane protein YhaH (DUF805 family)